LTSTPQIVCVLGMHRSGTSLITALLQSLGAHLGPPEHMMKPQPDNPRGFYEHQLLNDIDEEILARLGGSWSEPPVLTAGWETGPALGDLRQRARAVIQQDFAAAPLWSWKNPRTCLTLPFWQRLLPSMRYVICLRNPIDVARSLRRRNGFSLDKGVDLWMTHVTSSLSHTSGRRRLLMFYEDVMGDVDLAGERLAAFLGRRDLGERAEIREAGRALLEPESQHYATSIIDTVGEPRLAFPARALYLVLRAYVSGPADGSRAPGPVDAAVQEALDHFGRYSADFERRSPESGPAPRPAASPARDASATSELQAVADRAAEAEAEVMIASRRLQEAWWKLTEAERRLEVMEGLPGQLEEARQLAQAVEQEQVILRAELGRVQDELDVVRQSKSWRLTRPVRDLGARVRGLQAKVGRRVDGLRELWFRTAWDRVPFRALTPVPGEPDQANAGGAADVPHRVSYRFTVPPRACFRTRVSPLPDAGTGQGDMSVSVASGSSGLVVTRHWPGPRLEPGGARTRAEFWVDLRAFADQQVELTFSSSVGAVRAGEWPLAVWGDPAILSRRPASDVWALYAGYVRLYGVRGALSRRRLAAGSGVLAGSRGAQPQAVLAADLAAGESSATSVRSFLEQSWKDKLKLFLDDPSARLTFPAYRHPVVSIVIPTFNKAEYLYQCLESILAYTQVPFEVVVVDDCSQDQTPELLARLDNATWVRNDANLEFIRTSNRGAGLASGRYLLFLNNDVTVTPQWLSTLLATMERYPECGAVQGKLIRPDGTLQEAGTIIWRDGSALGYGRDDDPFRPEYSYVREVDYCSAACLLVRAELFRALGGLDERYLPAYYEDVDLCFGVRRLGYRVVFQPQVSVFHYEFGSRSFARAEALCRANQPKFARKWAAELEAQHPHGRVLRARDRRAGPRVLVMDDQIPAPHLGSGLPRTFKMLELMCELGYVITFVPLTIRTQHQPAARCLEQLGIEVFSGDDFVPEDLLHDRRGYYDIVVISRPHNGAKYLGLAQEHFPNARIVYDAEAVFSVREFLRAEVEGRALSEAQKRAMLRQELDIVKSADVIVTVSERERDVIVRETGHDQVVVWGHARDVRLPSMPFSKRRDLLFVGGFLHSHPPNTDAVMHFTNDLFPAIRERLPDCRFVIVGAEPPDVVRRLAAPHIVVAGYVDAGEEYSEKCRVFVVPLRFGAGISLKLVEAMSQGIPSVVTTVGATGLGLTDGREALIAGDDREFIDKVVDLYEDEERWTAVQRAAQDHVERCYSSDVMRERLAEVLGLARGEQAV
jgi:GT2 family glycosyltransferase/glycosyltransferase involved in cell wall biosynthesis